MNTAVVKVSKAAISARQGSRSRRPAARGWGQGVRLEDGRMSWPTGSPTRGERFDDPIDDQLRHAIAWDPNSSHDLAVAAGIPPATIDQFMQGDDVLTLRQAASLAPLLGLRLADQAIIEGFVRAWDRSGRGAIDCPPNRLVAGRRR
jgi:hypothetical protein